VTTTLLVFVVGSFPLHTYINDAETELKNYFLQKACQKAGPLLAVARTMPMQMQNFCPAAGQKIDMNPRKKAGAVAPAFSLDGRGLLALRLPLTLVEKVPHHRPGLLASLAENRRVIRQGLLPTGDVLDVIVE